MHHMEIPHRLFIPQRLENRIICDTEGFFGWLNAYYTPGDAARMVRPPCDVYGIDTEGLDPELFSHEQGRVSMFRYEGDIAAEQIYSRITFRKEED